MSTIIQPVSTPSSDEKKRRQRASKALSNARQRCTNPNNKDYAAYGGQGIKVLLVSVAELIAAIGLPPLKASLDRIDPHGHYEVGNVRWASKAVQAANKKASLAGSTPPLWSLVAQQKLAVQQENERPKKTEAWWILLKAFNRGALSKDQDAVLTELLELATSAHSTFRQREVQTEAQTDAIFRLPALTVPNAIVEARGPVVAAPDEANRRRCFDHGRIFGLRELEAAANMPPSIRHGINQLLKDETSKGLTLVGRPSDGDLSSGWFEVWMLAAASRLPLFNVRTGLFPALSCLQLLKEFGGQHRWDEIYHPLLDSHVLFVPDFQLDCGPWGYVSPYQFGMLERLLTYRIESGHKTVVGVQAPHRLSPQLQKTLMGRFEVMEIASGTKPQLM